MKKKDLIKILGPLIYIVIYLIDRFIVEIPDILYIPILIIALVFLIWGIILEKKS